MGDKHDKTCHGDKQTLVVTTIKHDAKYIVSYKQHQSDKSQQEKAQNSEFGARRGKS